MMRHWVISIGFILVKCMCVYAEAPACDIKCLQNKALTVLGASEVDLNLLCVGNDPTIVLLKITPDEDSGMEITYEDLGTKIVTKKLTFAGQCSIIKKILGKSDLGDWHETWTAENTEKTDDKMYWDNMRNPFRDDGRRAPQYVICRLSRQKNAMEKFQPCHRVRNEDSEMAKDAFDFLKRNPDIFKGGVSGESLDKLVELSHSQNLFLAIQAQRCILGFENLRVTCFENIRTEKDQFRAAVFTYMLLAEKNIKNSSERLMEWIDESQSFDSIEGISLGLFTYVNARVSPKYDNRNLLFCLQKAHKKYVESGKKDTSGVGVGLEMYFGQK